MPTPDESAFRNAQPDVPTLEQAKVAAHDLERWVMDRCPGGPWRALAPLDVVQRYLRGMSSTPAAPAIAAPAPDAEPAA